MHLKRFKEFDSKKDNSFILFNGDAILYDNLTKSYLFDPNSLYLDSNYENYRIGIGVKDGKSIYAVQLKDVGTKNISNDELDQIDLRYMLPQLTSEEFQLVSRAKQLLHWLISNKYCSYCGSENTFEIKEEAMYCSCNNIYTYPTISPCIITLVTNGNKILLARNKMFPQGMFSALAGFIEAGETAEEALVREVNEEVNLDVTNINYFASQSWPFPSQLMLGYYCECSTGNPVPDGIEIEEAAWFDINNLPNIPPPTSIAGKLINSYIVDR
jgi:NAD+ diphosphatase